MSEPRRGAEFESKRHFFRYIWYQNGAEIVGNQTHGASLSLPGFFPSFLPSFQTSLYGVLFFREMR